MPKASKVYRNHCNQVSSTLSGSYPYPCIFYKPSIRKGLMKPIKILYALQGFEVFGYLGRDVRCYEGKVVCKANFRFAGQYLC